MPTLQGGSKPTPRKAKTANPQESKKSKNSKGMLLLYFSKKAISAYPRTPGQGGQSEPASGKSTLNLCKHIIKIMKEYIAN